MMLCPKIKTCEEYQTHKMYSSVEKFRCSHKEYWSKCPLYLEDKPLVQRSMIELRKER